MKRGITFFVLNVFCCIFKVHEVIDIHKRKKFLEATVVAPPQNFISWTLSGAHVIFPYPELLTWIQVYSFRIIKYSSKWISGLSQCLAWFPIKYVLDFILSSFKEINPQKYTPNWKLVFLTIAVTVRLKENYSIS